MPVDPKIRELLDAAGGGPGLETLALAEARAAYGVTALLDGTPREVAEVVDRTVPGPAGAVPVRSYHPGGDGPKPVLQWMHSGGWTVGDLETADPVARRLCLAADALVVSVDYRLAPEHPAPAAFDDCWAVLQWLAAHAAELGGDPSRLAVGGDSAGGHLAAQLALAARDQGGPDLAHQLLVYPATDLSGSCPSIVENGDGLLLTRPIMTWFADNYAGGRDRRDPELSPLFAPDLSGVAPAQVLTAEFDPLRDEGNAYAERLADAGVPVVHRCYPSMPHLFFVMSAVTPVADEALADACEVLRAAW